MLGNIFKRKGKQDAMVTTVVRMLRPILTALGAGAVANGDLSAGDLDAIIGAIVTLATIGWSVYEKMQEQRAAPAPPPAK